MLRELITWVLNTYLGKYLENFNSAQLTVALLSGEVELENVPLRKDALQNLGLPLQIHNGIVGKIKLQVPVRQFRTAPWCIIIEKVDITIGPINLEEWDAEKEKLSDLNFKLSHLDDIESKWRAQIETNSEGYYASSYSGWLNYGTNLAANIIENLQLKINEVNIRYEDSITIPHSSFACGVTIESLSAQTCDANWNAVFTSSWNQSLASFKLIELKSLAFYWDSLDKKGSNSNEPNPLTSVNLLDTHQYIISPISAQARFRRDRSDIPLRTRSRPRLTCDIIVKEIKLSLSDFQYSHIIECIQGLHNINTVRKFHLLRPQATVTENPRLWWIYAAKCYGFKFRSLDEKRRETKDNLQYIKICKKLAKNPNEILSVDERQFKSQIETNRDFSELKILRQICLMNISVDTKLRSQSNQRSKMLFQWFPQWWGWYGNNTMSSNVATSPPQLFKPNEQQTNEENTDYDQNQFEDAILNAIEGSVENDSLLKRDAVFGKFEFVLTNGFIDICTENINTKEVKTMMEMNFNNLEISVETRPRSGSHLIGLALGSVCVKDCITVNTEYPDLIKPQADVLLPPFSRFQLNQKTRKSSTECSIKNSEPWFQLQYEKKPLSYNTDYRLAVKSKSLDIVYNIDALKYLIDFVSKPFQMVNPKQQIEAMKNKTKMKIMNNWKSIFDNDLGQRKSWSLEIDISAPQIIFVENFSKKNASIVLVDFGRFQLMKNALHNRKQTGDQCESVCNSEKLELPLSHKDSEDDEAFMTPCSTPPVSHISESNSPTSISNLADISDVIINKETGLEDAFHNKLYDKYIIDLTDLQILVCNGKERMTFASAKGTSALHVLDRFNISLQLERRVVHTTDPEYPYLTIFGTLPKLIAHINEHKILAITKILNILATESLYASNKFSDNSENESIGSENNHIDFEYDVHHDASKLIVLQFVVDQLSLEVQSKERSIAELQVSGVRVGLSKRSVDTTLSLSVHGLLLADAIQSFGPDFELLVASHRHVGMDSVSGSLRQSEPSSPVSPASPNTFQDKRPSSPQTINKAISSLQKDANSSNWLNFGDLDALIMVEILFVSSPNKADEVQIANIHFNNLDIIANQETIVELLDFIKRVYPNKSVIHNDDFHLRNKEQNVDKQNNAQNIPIRIDITFEFNRLNILVFRALMRDSYLVGRKVGTFTMSEARIHATFDVETSVFGSLGGLQILDLTPEGINHQRILSVGKDPLTEPPDMEMSLMNSLTHEIYGSTISKEEIHDLKQALSFHISKDVQAVVSVKIRMASVWYTHCARFMQELSWCASEFKHYIKNAAKSIRAKATGMAFGLVKLYEDKEGNVEKNTDNDGTKKARRKRSKKNFHLKLDVVLDTPVIVVPRSSCSSQVLVAHLGKISVQNNIDKQTLENPIDLTYNNESCENVESDDIKDKYSIHVRNVNLFSLETSQRKGFRLSALPRAEEFYSCQQDAVAILHDTAIQLELINIARAPPWKVTNEIETLSIIGNVTEPLQISLSRKQYEQLLETIDNIFKVPADLVRPSTDVPIIKNIDVEQSNSFDVCDDETKGNSIPNDTVRKGFKPKISFSLPVFIIRLKGENDSPLIEILLKQFTVIYEKSNMYETNIQISLRSISMEDLLCPTDSKYRQMVTSFSTEYESTRSFNGLSLSCPNLTHLQINNDSFITGSLPENLEEHAIDRRFLNSEKYNIRQEKCTRSLYCPDTPPPSPQAMQVEDNLVLYSARLVDLDCPGFITQYNSLRQTSSIDFNSLNLIISVERWFLLLDFFGLMADDDLNNYHKREEWDGHPIQTQPKDNKQLEIIIRSLTLILVRNETEIAKANISNAFFTVSQHEASKTVEGRLGSLSLFDLTDFGQIYPERFLTSGSEALKFIYKRENEKNNKRTLNKDSKLWISMSSARYVHTKRFVMEIQAFVKEFLQLQTPVMRKIKSSDFRHNLQQRPTQLGLEINIDSPIILLPLSFQSNQVILADLGEFSLKNSFHLASEKLIISKKSNTALLDEIIDVMQIDLFNTNFFTGTRIAKSSVPFKIENQGICLDMGTYWIIREGKNILEEKCHLKLQVEKNMDSWKSHNCPDFSVQGTLSKLDGVLDIEQYRLIRGFLSQNMGENIEDIYEGIFNVTESKINLCPSENEKFENNLIWTQLSINLNLEDVAIVLKLSANPPNDTNPYQSLACINFIKSSLKIDLFSDGCQDIDLVSQEILIKDSRFQNDTTPKNVFTNILQPILSKSGINLVQAEVHSRKRNEITKYKILLNNMRLMAIIDWLENMQDYLSQNAETAESLLNPCRVEHFTEKFPATNDTTPLELILNITDSELVFVEKTDFKETNAIILKSTTVVSYKPSDIEKPVSVNLNHLEVFSCILGYEEETALSIIDPITLNVDLKNHILEFQLQKQLCIRLSYHDVKMFIRMFKSLPNQTRTAQINEYTKSTKENSGKLYQISKLCSLGFQKSDCLHALEICRNELDEAAIWLTQNAESVKPRSNYSDDTILVVHAIEIHAQCISLCVIDDCKDADVPLLEISLNQLDFKQELIQYLLSSSLSSLTSRFCSGYLKSSIASDYYNRYLSGWEPMIEPWKCVLNWNYSVGKEGIDQSHLNIKLDSEDLLKFNITSTLIELWELVRCNWSQDYYEGNLNNNRNNCSQIPNVYRRRSPFIPFSLKNNTGATLIFKIMTNSPGGITQTEVSRDHSHNQWFVVEANQNIPFTFGEQNKLRHMHSHKLNLHQIIVRVENWSEVGPVSVDKVGTFFRHSHRETTADFPLMPKTRIVFDVSLEGSAQKLITVRSALRITNKVENLILLKMEHAVNYLGINDWPDAKTAIIGIDETFSIPLTHIHSFLYFRPLPSIINNFDEQSDNVNSLENISFFNGNEYWRMYDPNKKFLANSGSYFQFSDKSLHWKDSLDGLELQQDQRLCKGTGDKLYNIVTIVRRESYPCKDMNILPGHIITLIPPLRITNLLCSDLLYKFDPGIQGRIQPSKTANIFDVNLNDTINLNITLDGYKVSGQLSIPFGNFGAVETKLRLMDIKNRDLQLRVLIQSFRGSGMEIFLSAPYWIVNRTGLPLVFRQEGVPSDASGQFSENEQARLVSPLMFSFSDPEASPGLTVRLGKRFGLNPPWCQPLNLHKDVVHRQLKSGNSNENFIIGVEIRRGRGRYNHTSVVTFSPRFQLYNRSSHKLQFAQKCYAITLTNPETKSTIIDAVPGCHLPFHWPKLDKDQCLCVRLPDIPDCLWSGGIPINETQSLYVNIRTIHGDMHFLRLEIILQGATYFLLFGDAHALPPPIRIDNYSEVPIKFFQPGYKNQWRTLVKPQSSLSYALDEPMGSPHLQIEAPGGMAFTYSLRDLGICHNLTYDNFIFLAFKGTFQSPSITERMHMTSEFDIESQHLVLGVKDNRVILMRKRPGDRSQLWRMNQEKQLEHEGSSPPTEPGKKLMNLSHRLVLDLDGAPRPMTYVNLVVRPANKQRKSTQTWRFTEDGRLMCEHAKMCVQTRDGVFGLRPGCDAVLGMISSESYTFSDTIVPIEQAIERQKLRPGSGCLSVYICMDGPIKTIQIKDVNCTSDIPLVSDPKWKHASHIHRDSDIPSNYLLFQKDLVGECQVNINLIKGVGISVISKQPNEELVFITLEYITLNALATKSICAVDINVGEMQIDNQLLETPCPILLYTMKSNVEIHDWQNKLSALHLSLKLLPSPNENAVIFERFILSIRPFVLYLEERVLLRIAVFLGLGNCNNDAAAFADECDFEARQVATKILAANAKRYYFGELQIIPSQIRLSVITSSKLSTELNQLKKKLGLTLIKFEDALIEFEKFTDKHHFEPLELYIRAIKSHYRNELKWQAASILGSVDFLGNPLGFANDLSEGVSGLIFEGSVKSLVKSVTHGISNSTAKLTETISDGLGRVVLDEQDNETRQRILEVPNGANSSGEHLAAGIKGFGFGLLGGVTSIVKHTYEGAQNDGFQGFLSGLGKGIVGTVTKPLIGVLDLASETANAVRETSKSAHRILPERKRLPRCVSGAPGGLLPPYSSIQSKGQQHLFLINKRNFSEQLMSYEPNLFENRESRLRLLVSSENVWIFSKTDDVTTIILSYHLSEVVSCHPVSVSTTSDGLKLKKSHYYIELSLSLYGKSTVSASGLEILKRPRVRCQTEEMAQKASRHINYAKSVYDEEDHTLRHTSSIEF